MPNRSFSIDTNIIMRYLIPDNPELFAKAESILDRVAEGALTVFIDPIILAEVVFVFTNHYGRSREELRVILDPFLKSDNVLISNKFRYIRALEIYADTKAHFGDACACAAALEECDGRLFSFDRKLSEVEGISRVESPDTV